MKFLKTAALAGLVIAAVVVLALEPAAGAGTEWNVAACSNAIAGIDGTGFWAQATFAGPVGIERAALGKMSQTGNGELVGKVPLLLEDTKAVTVSVPPSLRGRVYLYYGQVKNRDGRTTTSIAGARGYGETEFQPCVGQSRTVWPGAIRIKGTGPIHLLVHQGGGTEPVPLRLGRPQIRRLER